MKNKLPIEHPSLSPCVNHSYPFRQLVYPRIMPKADRLSEKGTVCAKQSFKGNCKILRNVLAKGIESSYTQANQVGVYLFYNPLINFQFTIQLLIHQANEEAIDDHDVIGDFTITGFCKTIFLSSLQI